MQGRYCLLGLEKSILLLECTAHSTINENGARLPICRRLRPIMQISLPDYQDAVGEFGKPNPPAPFPPLSFSPKKGDGRGRSLFLTEGGAWKPLLASGRGLGRGLTPHQLTNSFLPIPDSPFSNGQQPYESF